MLQPTALNRKIQSLLFSAPPIFEHIKRMVFQSRFANLHNIVIDDQLYARSLLQRKQSELYFIACKLDDAYKYNIKVDTLTPWQRGISTVMGEKILEIIEAAES